MLRFVSTTLPRAPEHVTVSHRSISSSSSARVGAYDSVSRLIHIARDFEFHVVFAARATSDTELPLESISRLLVNLQIRILFNRLTK